MATFKCKMCGGALDIGDGCVKVIECEYCGTQQTLPKSTDENVQSLFNRANLLRQKSEFDKAEAIYEKIIGMDETESEAYWGVILCKFGIEYVEDPNTLKRIPTCHRTSYDSIVADEYYKKTLEHADMSQRAIYESEAKAIDEIQKGILAISAKEEPYDVFICYKETDENGKRTQDSVIANDIYHQLTDAGYKVFYAAITLESKLGSAYEPIIFAALNSAKVMLAIGTKADYFNAVWVKNEWSRFLKMMKTDRSKLLIPCYRDMDAYELPEEFAHLQAQDMSKIGFMSDIVRGIKKVITKNGQTSAKEADTNVSTAPTTELLLKNAYLYLEDGSWTKAREYCTKVIELDIENVQAYLGELLATMQVKKKEELKNCTRLFDSQTSYKRLMRFADDTLKKELEGYASEVAAKTKKKKSAIKKRCIAAGIIILFLALVGQFVVYPVAWYHTGDHAPFIKIYHIKDYKIKDGITGIGASFMDCTSLRSITIPNSVISIGDISFMNCTNLEIVYIPKSIKHIDGHAFLNCSSLKYIYYEGTEEEWNALPKATTWDEGTGNYTVIYNYKG